MTEITTLAPFVLPVLVRYLPQMLEAGKFVGGKALEKFVENAADEAWKFAQPWLGKLMSRIESEPAALKAAERVALAPANADYQTALKVELAEVLAGAPQLADEIGRLLEQARRENLLVQQGDRSVFVKGDNTGTIITGDGNR
jgi:hypothetical protein